MKYLVDQLTHQIEVEAELNSKEWITGLRPDVICHEGEEADYGYEVIDIPEEDVRKVLWANEKEDADVFYIEGEVLPRNKVQFFFSAYVTHPDFPDERQMWIPLSDEEIDKYQTFVMLERVSFKARHRDQLDNDELWHAWLDDAIANADFQTEISNAMNPVPAHVVSIDLDNPKVEKII